MRKTTITLCVVLLSIPAVAETVSKQAWGTQMEAALAASFCQSDAYYRQCFSISASQCKETASSVTKACLAKSGADIPDPLQQPADGTRWGNIVGRCAGNAFEAAQAQAKQQNSRCQDAKNWLPSK
ncbi:MAG: hypothetical protein ABJ308_16360 [Halieaceae bacterium]